MSTERPDDRLLTVPRADVIFTDRWSRGRYVDETGAVLAELRPGAQDVLEVAGPERVAFRLAHWRSSMRDRVAILRARRPAVWSRPTLPPSVCFVMIGPDGARLGHAWPIRGLHRTGPTLDLHSAAGARLRCSQRTLTPRWNETTSRDELEFPLRPLGEPAIGRVVKEYGTGVDRLRVELPAGPRDPALRCVVLAAPLCMVLAGAGIAMPGVSSG